MNSTFVKNLIPNIFISSDHFNEFELLRFASSNLNHRAPIKNQRLRKIKFHFIKSQKISVSKMRVLGQNKMGGTPNPPPPSLFRVMFLVVKEFLKLCLSQISLFIFIFIFICRFDNFSIFLFFFMISYIRTC